MSPPLRQRFDRDFEIDLGAELGLDNPYPGSHSRTGRVVLIIVGLCVCLAVGIAVGYVTTRQDDDPVAVEIAPPKSTDREQASSSPAMMSEAERTVQRRLSAVALEAAGDVIGAATRRGSAIASPPRPSVEPTRRSSTERRSRRAEPEPRSFGPGPLVPFGEDLPPSLEERFAPLLEIEQTDPYAREH